MKRVIIAFAAIALILSAAELFAIASSPRLGLADAESIRRGGPDNGFFLSDPALYLHDYDSRPHSLDPWAGTYKMKLIGWWVVDSMSVGVTEWQTGTFTACMEEEDVELRDTILLWKRQRPRVVASGLNDMGRARFKGYMDQNGLGGGAILSLPLGWYMLADSIGGNYAHFFTVDCAAQNNMSAEKLRKARIEMHRSFLARNSFVDSAINERVPFRGILYLAHYPDGKSFIVLSGITEEEAIGSSLVVNEKAVPHSLQHPFIFFEKALPVGENVIAFGQHSVAFDNPPDEPFWIEGLGTSFDDDGMLHMTLVTAEDDVDILSVSVDGREVKGFARHMPPFNATLIEANIGKPEEGEMTRLIEAEIAYEHKGEKMISKQRFFAGR